MSDSYSVMLCLCTLWPRGYDDFKDGSRWWN